MTASRRETYVRLSVSVSIVRIKLFQIRKPEVRDHKWDANVQNHSVKKIIANAFKKIRGVIKNAGALGAKIVCDLY